jgi:hypothetical protein
LESTGDRESGTDKYAYETAGYGHEPFFDTKNQWYYSGSTTAEWTTSPSCRTRSRPPNPLIAAMLVGVTSDGTHMPHYVGAGSKQNWMRTDLMILPS